MPKSTAIDTNVIALPKKALSASDKAFRRSCAVAVLNGIRASYGSTILDDEARYATALRAVSRTAFQQADEMLRREASENG